MSTPTSLPASSKPSAENKPLGSKNKKATAAVVPKGQPSLLQAWGLASKKAAADPAEEHSTAVASVPLSPVKQAAEKSATIDLLDQEISLAPVTPSSGESARSLLEESSPQRLIALDSDSEGSSESSSPNKKSSDSNSMGEPIHSVGGDTPNMGDGIVVAIDDESSRASGTDSDADDDIDERGPPRKRQRTSTGSPAAESHKAEQAQEVSDGSARRGSRSRKAPSATAAADAPPAAPVAPLVVPPVARLPDGTAVLPLLIRGNVSVVSLGRIDSTRPAFRSKLNLWPIGFKSIRHLASAQNPAIQVPYTSEIVEGADGKPCFTITPGDDLEAVVRADSASSAWREMLGRIRRAQGHTEDQVARISVSGPEQFGLSHPQVKMLIQALKGAFECSKEGIPSRYERADIIEGDVASVPASSSKSEPSETELAKRQAAEERARAREELAAKKRADREEQERIKQQQQAEREAAAKEKAAAKAAAKQQRDEEAAARKAEKDQLLEEKRIKWEQKQQKWAADRAEKERIKVDKEAEREKAKAEKASVKDKKEQPSEQKLSKAARKLLAPPKRSAERAPPPAHVPKLTQFFVRQPIAPEPVKESAPQPDETLQFQAIAKMDAAIIDYQSESPLSVRDCIAELISSSPPSARRWRVVGGRWVFVHTNTIYTLDSTVAHKQRSNGKIAKYTKNFVKKPLYCGPPQRSIVVTARQPLAKDPTVEYDAAVSVDAHDTDFAYAYDELSLYINTEAQLSIESEGEAEPDDGEDIVESDAADAEVDVDIEDDEDQFVVEDGYLSLSEGFHSSSDSEGDGLGILSDPIVRKAQKVNQKVKEADVEVIDVDAKDAPSTRLRALHQGAHHTTRLLQRCTGPVWDLDMNSDADGSFLSSFGAVVFDDALDQPRLVDLVTSRPALLTPEPSEKEVSSKKKAQTARLVPDDLMPILLSQLHGSLNGIDKAVKAFLELVYNPEAPKVALDEPRISKRQVDIAVRSVAEKSSRPGYRGLRWWVFDSAAERYATVLPEVPRDLPVLTTLKATSDSPAPPTDDAQVATGDPGERWQKAVDAKGREYYWNAATRAVSWELPEGAIVEGACGSPKKRPADAPADASEQPAAKKMRQQPLSFSALSPPRPSAVTAVPRTRVAPIVLDE